MDQPAGPVQGDAAGAGLPKLPEVPLEQHVEPPAEIT
jgi:hypothetical protein